MQGYSQGEPIGYAGMAAPFAAPAAVATAKALAPKAGMMAENYMVKQGMIQPLTAYHGTPHTIQGQFDINKVGTGEGAQAYGHGMYFAENPAVANEYANMFSKSPASSTQLTKLRDSAPVGSAEYKHYDELIGKSGQGNLYKVDIPDADIPNMLDWDKPLSQQPKAVQDALAKYDPDSFSPKGMDYDSNQRGQWIYMRLAGDTTQKNASNKLNELGIKGIRYLDEGSRKTGGTSNFVVFDPSTVKILEKNDKPVTRKELIQEQIDKIE
jgi:hypothetical protein